MVLRHQVLVLRRQVGASKLSWAGRAIISALVRRIPRTRRLCVLVAPRTLLRWHVHLVRRRWTYPRRGPARPPARPTIRVLVLHLASPLRALPDPVDADVKVIRRDRLGGLLHEYAQVA